MSFFLQDNLFVIQPLSNNIMGFTGHCYFVFMLDIIAELIKQNVAARFESHATLIIA